MSSVPLPKIGDAVHYVAHGTPIRPDGTQAYVSACRAALVTEIGAWITVETTAPTSFDRSEGRPIRVAEQWFYDDALVLMVANPSGQFFSPAIRFRHTLQGIADAGGTWHHRNACFS